METERVNDLIARVILKHPGQSNAALLNYFEAVHQELAPLARNIERQRDHAWNELREIRDAINANSEEATVDEVRRVVAQRDELLAALEIAVPYVQAAGAIIHLGDDMMIIDSAIARAKDQFRDAAKMIGAPATANYPHGSLGEAVDSEGGEA